MAEPFRDRSQDKPPRASFGAGRRKRAFLHALETVLAQADRVTDVGPAKIDELAREHGVDLERELATPRRALYRQFLEWCLNDHVLSSEESDELDHLRKLLGLRDNEARAAHQEVAQSIYGGALDEVLADFRLDPEEEEFLRRLRDAMGISPQDEKALREQGRKRARVRFVQKAVVPGSAILSPQGTTLDLEGSEDSLQAAVEAAVASTRETLADAASAELVQLRVDIRSGAVERWSVKLRTKV